MNYAVVLAGGIGTRIKSTVLPKQFLTIGNKVILLMTVEKFLLCQNIDKVVVTAPRAWIEHTKDCMQDAIFADVDVCEGGATRQESLYNALRHIEGRYGVTPDDICVSHDAARPFVSLRIIEDNITLCRKHGAVDTVIPATDTIVSSTDGEWLSAIPARKTLYQGQTPQSFFIRSFLDIYEKLDPHYLEQMTDAARILLENGVPVALVRGEEFNIKLTTDYDLGLADYILNGFNNA